LQIDLDDLRRHYESLTDDELLEIEPSELTEQARGCFEGEVRRRGLSEQPSPENSGADGGEGFPAEPHETEDDPNWLDTAACACSYFSHAGGTAAEDADTARATLLDAGIPCEVTVADVEREPPDANPPKQFEYRVMVPGALNLQATSVLDRDLFNAALAADWKTHFEALTDDELRQLTPEVICAGWADKIARLKRAYQEEVARRKLKR
jgi:hypothetical protein